MKWVKSPNGVTEEHTAVNASELVRHAGWTYVSGATEKDTPDERPIGDTTPTGEPEGNLAGEDKADANVAVNESAGSPVGTVDADTARGEVDGAEGEAAVAVSEDAAVAPKKGKRSQPSRG